MPSEARQIRRQVAVIADLRDHFSALQASRHKKRQAPDRHRENNWLVIDGAEAGERSAILYTVIESCRRRGIDPFAYLRDILTRLPTMTNRQIPEVTPEAWAKAQRTAQRAAAS
jgi:IS66 C-terminal element